MSEYYADDRVTLRHGDALAELAEMPAQSVNCIVTSPPYFGLRDYGTAGQIGAEATPVEFIAAIVAVFREARRVLSDDGTLWLNLGDSYSTYPGNRGRSTGIGAKRKVDPWQAAPKGSGLSGDRPMKNMIGIPWRVAFALQDDGWTLRNSVIWHKPNAMPESVTDRLAVKHEHLFLFSKKPRYWFDLDALREPGAANPGDVWTIPTQPFRWAHFATMPPELAERCVKAGCRPDGVVLDPFSGSGTTGLAAARHGRRYVGIDLNRDYLDLSLQTRLAQAHLLVAGSGFRRPDAVDFDGKPVRVSVSTSDTWLTTHVVTMLLGMTRTTFHAAMSRERQRGRDYRAPRETWPDARTPLWDADAVSAWDAGRQRRTNRKDQP